MMPMVIIMALVQLISTIVDTKDDDDVDGGGDDDGNEGDNGRDAEIKCYDS